jgi:hypothetical protein
VEYVRVDHDANGNPETSYKFYPGSALSQPFSNVDESGQRVPFITGLKAAVMP